MLEIKLDKAINGSQLIEEIGIANLKYAVCGDSIVFDADDSEKNLIIDKLQKHTPAPFTDHRASALAKLAALGLSADEIAAL